MTTSWTKLTNNQASWTNLPKPVGTSSVVTFTYSGGTPLGTLMAITISSITSMNVVTTSNWTSVVTGTTPWTSVPKAT